MDAVSALSTMCATRAMARDENVGRNRGAIEMTVAAEDLRRLDQAFPPPRKGTPIKCGESA